MKLRTPTLLIGTVIAALCTMTMTPSAKASDVMIILDASGSMKQKTSDGVIRMDAAKQAVASLTKDLSQEQVSLMIFGHRKSPKQVGACEDIETAIPFGPMNPTKFQKVVQATQALGNTPLANSLILAKKQLLGLDRDSQKAVIVLTDGNETCGGDPVAAAGMLAGLGINVKVHVVGFAVGANEEKQLLTIAGAGGGQYVSAKNAAELKKVLSEIVKTALLTSESNELERAEVYQDTFEGAKLNDFWEVLRPDDARYAPVDGKLMVLTQFVAPWSENEKIANFVQSKAPIAAKDYEVAVTVSIKRTMQHHGGGLLLYQDANNYVELAAYSDKHGYNLKKVLRFTKVVEGKVASFTMNMGNGAAKIAEVLPLKIVKRGVIFSAFVELPKKDSDERVWVLVGRHGAPGINKPHAVLKAANGASDHYGGGKVSEAEVTFDDFAISSSVWETKFIGGKAEGAVFSTTFDNPAEFGAHFTIMNKEKSHIALDRGLTVASQLGLFGDEKNPVKNLTLLNDALPDGDYDAEVQVSFQLTSQKPEVGLVLYQDDGNYLLLGRFGQKHGYNVKRTDVFRKVTNKIDSPVVGGAYRAGSEAGPITHILKIEKRGRKYTGKIYTPNEKTGEHEWLTVGEQTVLKMNAKLGLVAHNLGADHYGGGPAHEIVVRFERLVITAK